MTAKEKAQELFTHFHWNKDNVMNVFVAKELAKNRALFCVNELMQNTLDFIEHRKYDKIITFWNDVKKEIELI